MKRISICLLSMVLGTGIHAEVVKRTVSNPDGTNSNIFYLEESEIARQKVDGENNSIESIGRIPDGTVKEYYEDGRLKREWEYKNGKLEGISRVYYQSGELMYENHYKAGEREGSTKRYYRGGRIMYEYNYKGGKLESVIRKYYRNGKLAYEWNYKDGKREGITKSYYKSGSLLAQWNYKGDQLEGIARIYYEDGGIRYIDTYRNGQKVNRKAYDRRGKLEFDQDYPFEEGGKNSITEVVENSE